MSEDKKEPVSETSRLQLYIKQLKIKALTAQMEAISQRRNALVLELDSLPRRHQELQQQRDELLKEYQTEYGALKKSLEVPEGSEVNLETGEIVQV